MSCLHLSKHKHYLCKVRSTLRPACHGETKVRYYAYRTVKEARTRTVQSRPLSRLSRPPRPLSRVALSILGVAATGISQRRKQPRHAEQDLNATAIAAGPSKKDEKVVKIQVSLVP